jgi:hypothetical protein
MGRKASLSTNIHGNYKRDLGKNKDGKAHRFYFGSDKVEAAVRNAKLEQVWHGVCKMAKEDMVGPAWDDTTLSIAKAVAAGESVCYLEVDPDIRDHANEEYEGEQRTAFVACWVQRLQEFFPGIKLRIAGQERGEKILQQEAEQQIRRGRELIEHGERRLHKGSGSLHAALDEYALWFKTTYVFPGTSRPTPSAMTGFRQITQLKNHHADMALSAFDWQTIKSMINYWKSRPVTKLGTPASRHTINDNLKRLKG